MPRPSARTPAILNRRSQGETRRDPGRVFQVLIVVWSAVCMLWIAASLLLGLGVRDQAAAKPDTHEAAAAAGCLVSSLGATIGGVAWIVGLVPLAILFLVFRRRD